MVVLSLAFYLQNALDLLKRVRGPTHPDTLTAMANLSTTLKALDRHAEAERLSEKVLKLRTEVLGPNHPQTLQSKNLATKLANTKLGKLTKKAKAATMKGWVCICVVLSVQRTNAICLLVQNRSILA